MVVVTVNARGYACTIYKHSSAKGWVLGAAVKSTAANDSFNSFKSIWQLVLTGHQSEQTLLLSNRLSVRVTEPFSVLFLIFLAILI